MTPERPRPEPSAHRAAPERAERHVPPRPSTRPGPVGELLGLHRTVGNHSLATGLSGGTALDGATRAGMEAAFGRDLGHVRLHTDSSAASSVSAAGARAYTVGRHIFLDPAALRHGNAVTRHLLAHELAHVVQQERGGPQDPALPGAHEEHADRAADAVVAGRSAVDVGHGTRVGPARAPAGEPAGGSGWSLIGQIAETLGGRLLEAVGLPPGARLARSAMRGFSEEVARQLFKDDKSAAALFLKRVATMSAGDFGQFYKGYASGLVEGVASPVTDLVGLAAFAEHVQQLRNQLLGSIFAGRQDIVGDLEQLGGRVRKLLPDWRRVWANAKADPKGTVLGVLGAGEELRAGADAMAYNLGKSGAQAMTATLEEPFQPPQHQEKSETSLLGAVLRPATTAVAAGRALVDRVQNTPWAKLGGKFGYVLGSLVIQLVLLVFSGGVGNLIEQVAQKIGSLGSALGRLAKPIGTAVTRLAEFLGEVGRGVAVVEDLVARVLAKALAPLERVFGPVLKPLSEAAQELRTFLRKLLGVAEKDGVQLAEKAAGAATKNAPRPDISPTPRPAPHGAPAPSRAAPPPGHPYREPTPPVPEQPHFPVHEKPTPPVPPAQQPARVPVAPGPLEPAVQPPTRRRIDPSPFKESPDPSPRRRPEFEIDPRFRKPGVPTRRPEVAPRAPVPPEPVKTPPAPLKPPEPLPKPPEPLPKPPEPLPPKAAPSAESVLAPEPPVAVRAGAEVAGPASAPARTPALVDVAAETEAAGSVAAPVAGSGGRPPVRATAEGSGAGQVERRAAPQGPAQPQPEPGPRPAAAVERPGAGEPPPPVGIGLADRHEAEIDALVKEGERLGQRLDRKALREAAAARPDDFAQLSADIRERMKESAQGLTGRAAQVQAEFREAGEHFRPGHAGPGRPRPEISLRQSHELARKTGVPSLITDDATVMTKADVADLLPGGGTRSTRPAPTGKPITRGVGQSTVQNIDVQHDIRLLREAGATNIRVNQAQVDVAQQLKLGTNRPDVQATLGGRRVHIEYDRAPGDRALQHAHRILANDPEAIVILKIVDF